MYITISPRARFLLALLWLLPTACTPADSAAPEGSVAANASDSTSISPTPPADLAPARDDFAKYCASCHGDGGRGDGPMGRFLEPTPKDLTDRTYMRTRTDEQIFSAIHDGGASVGLSDKMAPWKHLLSEEQIRELAEYVRWLSEGSSED